VSDHYVLVVKNKMIDWSPKPFKMFDVWLAIDGFKEVVKKAWDQGICSRNSFEREKIKLKELKQKLKEMEGRGVQ